MACLTTCKETPKYLRDDAFFKGIEFDGLLGFIEVNEIILAGMYASV